MPTNDGFDFNATGTNAFIQWKGTDVCMDFYCDCGEQCHFDGYFAYAVECPYCRTVWEMPHTIYPRKNPNYTGCTPVRPETDDD